MKIIKPVLFMSFNRPEKTKRVFDEIRKAQPRKLYLSVDGPRKEHPEDRRKIEQVKKIVTNVHWECEVNTLFHENNLGCTLAGKTAFDWVFSKEDDMIQLEDDVVPSQSFFRYCQELLDRYKYNEKISDNEKNRIVNNLDDFELKDLYQNHKDIVLELIQKEAIYNESYLDELLTQYEGTLFKNREDLQRLISGGYVSDNELGKRPLSKLIKDISQELGLI